MSATPLHTVAEVLGAFEEKFTAFADAFAAGDYVLWLGSGISRDRMPPVEALVEGVVELLRSNIDPDDGACRFRTALEQVLDLTALTPAARESIDFATPVAAWTVREELVISLVGNYSKVLGVPVANEAPDYLVWTGLDVPNTYGDPSIDPDVDHRCIAILMLEGVVDVAVTSNWDGLVEKAFDQLDSALGALRVVVDAQDLQRPALRGSLIKFHGCAIRAVQDEHTYRKMLIARSVQIERWPDEHPHMKNKLQAMLSERNTLVVGLSVQDGNMRAMFAGSAHDLAHTWPAVPPALVLSEQRLHANHREALELIYGDDYHPHAMSIAEGAVLGAYAKPTLVALVLWTLTEKLVALAEAVSTPHLRPMDLERLKADLRAARVTFGELVGDDLHVFFDRLLDTTAAIMSLFRQGRVAPMHGKYVPLTVKPVASALADPDFPAAQLGRFAVALSLLGRGHHAAEWAVQPDSATGALLVDNQSDTKRVFIVRDSRQALALEKSDDFDAEDEATILIYADQQAAPRTRSPRAAYGRNGRAGAARFSIEDVLTEATSADELYDDFKLAGGFG